MKILFLALLLVFYSQARITIPLEKVRIERPDSEGFADAAVATGFLAKSSDSLKVNFWNQRNFFYFGNVFVGSQNKTMKVLFDTGSNNLWLSTPQCVGCPGANRFSCAESTTCTKSSNLKSVSYGKGSVDGYTGSEMVGLTPTFRTKVPILMVTSGSDMAVYNIADGFLGLGSRNNAEDFIDQAFKDGFIEEKIFSISMDYNGDDTMQKLTYGSYLTLGYVPEDKINNLAWIPVTDSDRWGTDILGVKIGGTVLTGSAARGKILFDSGSSVNHFNSDIRNEFMAQMKAFDFLTYSALDWWPCKKEDLPKYPNISLSVSGLRIDVTPWSYLDFPSSTLFNGHLHCQIIVLGTVEGLTILGDAFLQENFMAYSKRNQSIGINVDGKHQVLPSPNPPLFDILIFVGAMLVIGAVLLVNNKKRKLIKTALSDQEEIMIDSSQQQIL